jgi:tetratricopeptide (TPR) repeat protein
MDFHPPLGIATTIARWGLAGLLWLLRRPFLFSRRLWVCATLLALLVDAVAWLLGPPLLALALLVLPLLGAAVLGQWWWLGRGKDPIVFVSLFRGRSRIGRETAETHLGALAAYLRESEHLAVVGPLDIRVISLPLSEAQAERLLRISKALVVVRGTGDAAAETSRWEWWAHFRDERPEFMLNEHRFSLSSVDSKPSFLDRLRSVPAITTSHDVEGDLEVAEFLATSIRIRHFGAVSKVIGILASELVFEGRLPGRTFLIPEPDEPGLSPGLQGRTAILEAISNVSTDTDREATLDRLQELCLAGCGDVDFALWLQLQWFTATVERRRSYPEALVAELGIVERFPDDVNVLVNVAGAAVEAQDLEGAEELAERAERVDPTDFGVSRVLGNIAWSRHEPAEALRLYRAGAREGSPLARQMGDCHLALGDPERALACYREALRKSSSSGLATRKARDLLGIPRLLPTVPDDWHARIWTLLHRHPRVVRPALGLWRRRRPEDPWLEAFLGRHALVGGNLEVAREWSGLATRFAETNQLIPAIDTLVTAYLEGRPDLEQGAQLLREHLAWLTEIGVPSPAEEAADALALLLSSSRRLSRRLAGDEGFHSLLAAAGIGIP